MRTNVLSSIRPASCLNNDDRIIDLQPQMLFGVSDFDRQSIINNNLVLSKAARVFDIPVVLSSVETKGLTATPGRRSSRCSPARCPSSARR
jgi:nicotinamidase-related amidase